MENNFTIETEKQMIGENEWIEVQVLKHKGSCAGILGHNLSKLSHEELLDIVRITAEMAFLMGQRDMLSQQAELKESLDKLLALLGKPPFGIKP